MAGLIAGCVTDGMIGAEAETQAKPRVIDTPKTRSSAAKKDSQKAAPTAQGDTGPRSVSAKSEPDLRVAAVTPPPPPAEGPMIPAQSLFGTWTLGQDGGAKCRLILGGVPIGTAYAARSENDCPQAFTAVQTWEIQGDQIVLRNQSRGVVGRLQATGPFRFDGQGGDGAAVYLVR